MNVLEALLSLLIAGLLAAAGIPCAIALEKVSGTVYAKEDALDDLWVLSGAVKADLRRAVSFRYSGQTLTVFLDDGTFCGYWLSPRSGVLRSFNGQGAVVAGAGVARCDYAAAPREGLWVKEESDVNGRMEGSSFFCAFEEGAVV